MSLEKAREHTRLARQELAGCEGRLEDAKEVESYLRLAFDLMDTEQPVPEEVTLSLSQREALFLEETLRQSEARGPVGFEDGEDIARDLLNRLGSES